VLRVQNSIMKEKIKDLGVIKCPVCKNIIEIKLKRETITESIKGVYVESLEGEISKQKELNGY
jgi:phage FluMu protein Com